MDSDFDSDSDSDFDSRSKTKSKFSTISIRPPSSASSVNSSGNKERFSPEDSLAELYVNKDCFKDTDTVTKSTMDNLAFLYTENLVDVKLPDKITKANMCRNFKAGINPIISKVRAPNSKFCSGLASPYVRRSLHSSMMTLCIKSTTDSTMYGFLTMGVARGKRSKKDNDKINIIDIDIVCANSDYSGVGTYMVQVVKKMAPILDCSRITLQSVTEALPFYLKNKFECDDDYCPMMYDLDNDSDNDVNKPRNILRSKPNRFRSEYRSRPNGGSKSKVKSKSKSKKGKNHKRTYRKL